METVGLQPITITIILCWSYGDCWLTAYNHHNYPNQGYSNTATVVCGDYSNISLYRHSNDVLGIKDVHMYHCMIMGNVLARGWWHIRTVNSLYHLSSCDTVMVIRCGPCIMQWYSLISQNIPVHPVWHWQEISVVPTSLQVPPFSHISGWHLRATICNKMYI